MNVSVEKMIDGNLFENLVLCGAQNLKAHLKTVNDLNVFPIPDGDTGDNMYMTLSGGLNGIKAVKENSVGLKASALANGMLLNARGNSGVILSQLFAGIAKGFESVEEASVIDFAEALKSGVKQAYSSVVKPVEGTILTVAREATEYVNEHTTEYKTISEFFYDYTKEMRKSLERTPDMLDVLREAGVIDSGGAGLLYIVEGMKRALEGDTSFENTEGIAQEKTIDFSKFNEDSEMKYGYCTECLLQLLNSKVNAKEFDVQEIINYLESIDGDSIVAFKVGTVIKLHVHTMTPYKVLEYCQKFGEFLSVKIENMTLQHNETSEDFALNIKVKKQRPHKEFALVTVAMGKGLCDTFIECGADIVIDGGQGHNPSIEDFINAFDEVNADNIFVLPNNSNIIMAAKQAANMYEKSKIYVLETKNFGQAYSILSMLDFTSHDAEEILARMKEDMNSAVTGMITPSIRDANIDGVAIKKNDYIGFTDKTMLVSNVDRKQTFNELLAKLSEEKSFLIVVYGKDVLQEERISIAEMVTTNYPSLEFYEINGEQDVYDYILILE